MRLVVKNEDDDDDDDDHDAINRLNEKRIMVKTFVVRASERANALVPPRDRDGRVRYARLEPPLGAEAPRAVRPRDEARHGLGGGHAPLGSVFRAILARVASKLNAHPTQPTGRRATTRERGRDVLRRSTGRGDDGER